MATKMVQLTVPAGKFGGDVMVCECLDKRGKKQSVEVVIPLGLKPGATFSLPDPAESVTLHGIEASMYSASWPCSAFCGAYDEVPCWSKDKSTSCAQRYVCVASSVYCCAGSLCMFFLMVLAMAGTIYNIAVIEGGEWPTISVQGDLDPTNIYTLQGWAYDEFKATARDAVSDWEALQNGGNDDDDDDSNSTDDQIKQTQVNRDWNLLAIFRVRGELGAPGRNLLTPDRIGFMKGVQDRLMNVGADDGYPAFEDVCLKKPVNYTPSFLFAAPEMDNETVLECALPSSPLNHFYASQTEDHAYNMYGDRFFDTTQDEGFASQLRLLVGGLLTFSLVDFGDFNVSNATNFTNFTSFNNTGNFSNFTEYFNALTDDDDDFDFNETAFRDFFDDLEEGDADENDFWDALNDLAANVSLFGNRSNSDNITANIQKVSERAAVSLFNQTALVFDGRGDVLAPCGLSESDLRYVEEQMENFACILDPLIVLDDDDIDEMAAVINDTYYLFSDEEADALGWPYSHIFENVTSGRPAGFCSQCYSQSCFCEAVPAANSSNETENLQSRIDSISALMASTPFLAMSFGGEFNTSNLESGVMLFSMDFGGPLEGFATVDEGENGSFFDPPGPQSTVFGEWASAAYEVLDAYGAEGEGDIEVVYFWGIALPDITLNLLIHDVILVTGSVTFIFFYMWFHTQSCCLSGMGLVHIFASLPIAFLIYYYGFGIEPFYTLNFLSVYVILAIGADDVFVMVDAWKQMGHLPPSERMAQAFQRASKAMLITSATTSAAFLATAFSPLLDVSTFGLYTACLVISNYISVITYYLGVIMFYHLKIEYCCCCAPRRATAIPKRRCCELLGCSTNNLRKQIRMRLEDQVYQVHVAEALHQSHVAAMLEGSSSSAKVAPAIAAAPDLEASPSQHVNNTEHLPSKNKSLPPLSALDSAGEPKLPILEKFCGDFFFRFLSFGPVRFVAPSILVAFTVIMAWSASNLGPTTQADAFLPAWHPVQRFLDVFETDFGTSSDTDMKVVHVVFGLDPTSPMDRSAFGRFELEMGPLTMFPDAECDFASPELQLAVYDMCEEFAALTPTGTTSSGAEQFLVRQGSGLNEFEVNCWQRSFKTWFEDEYEDSSFPCTLDNCTDIIMRFASEWSSRRSSEKYSDRIFLRDGRIAGTSFAVNSTETRFSVVYTEVKSAFEAWQDWSQTYLADHPLPCMRSGMHVAEDRDKAWVFLNTQDLLISGAFSGSGISLVVAFFVLWVATGNIVVTAVASSCMLCVTVCIMGMMFVLGWELGTIESISATILVGLSVDYVVHIAQAYVEADAVKRVDRVQLALYEMGSTVFGGAMTSLGASAMLFGCWIQYFFKFGGFMFLTIALSFLFCFLFFMPLMMICGPNRTKEVEGKLYDPLSFQSCFKYGGMDPPPGYLMQSDKQKTEDPKKAEPGVETVAHSSKVNPGTVAVEMVGLGSDSKPSKAVQPK
eukprot:INCI7785.2.p1 GENE.INCI7785.2~~INCI7785.2.p1  ORF type:complete len:1466 (+),score=281.45 INCI7785.2:324-4721(+)